MEISLQKQQKEPYWNPEISKAGNQILSLKEQSWDTHTILTKCQEHKKEKM